MDQGLRASFYLIDTALDKQQLESLNELSKRPGGRWYEFIIVHTPKSKLRLAERVMIADGNNLARDLVTAGGKWIVIINFEELQMHFDYMIDSFMKIRHGNAAVPISSKTPLKQKLGLRSLGQASFVAYKKHFMANTIYLESALKDKSARLEMVKLADKQATLFFLRDSSVLAPQAGKVLPAKSVFLRPYLRILLRVLGGLLKNLYILAVKTPKTIKAYYGQLTVKKIVYEESMPVFINCRDRLKPLKELIKWLEDEGLKNIILIDNDSTYPPLLDFYSKNKYKVVRIRENAGHTAAWLCGILRLHAKGKAFILTDPDIIPAEGSHGAVKHFVDLLNKYPKYQKVGFGLKIDDLPDTYELKPTVINWESQFWEKEIEKDVFSAEIDTTFAVCRPDIPYLYSPALRTGGRFMARHEPWYIDSNNIDQEMTYYRAHADKSVGSWGIEGGDASEVYERHEDNVVHGSA